MKAYISNLRNVSTFAVILLHVAANYVTDFKLIPMEEWRIANFIDSLLRFCVPAFLMISGAVLLDKEEKLNVFISKRLKRIIIPFAFWNICYFLYNQANKDFTLFEGLKKMIDSLWTGESFHFWYVHLIIGIYLFIPILRRWLMNASKSEVQYFLAIWIFTLFANQYFSAYFAKIELMYFSEYLGYLVLGYYIDKYVDLNKLKVLSYVMFALGVFLTYYLTEFYSLQQGKFQPVHYGFLAPNVALTAVGIFIIIKNLNLKTNNITKTLDSCSYGIYLIHILVMNFFVRNWDINMSESAVSVLIEIICLGLLTYLSSFLIIYVLSRIKFLKAIVT